MGADFGIVGFAATYVVDGLCGDAGALEEFGREGVRGGHIGSKAMALIQPVGLPKFSDDVVPLVLLAEYQFAHVDDLRGEDLTCGPVGFN